MSFSSKISNTGLFRVYCEEIFTTGTWRGRAATKRGNRIDHKDRKGHKEKHFRTWRASRPFDITQGRLGARMILSICKLKGKDRRQNLRKLGKLSTQVIHEGRKHFVKIRALSVIRPSCPSRPSVVRKSFVEWRIPANRPSGKFVSRRDNF